MSEKLKKLELLEQASKSCGRVRARVFQNFLKKYYFWNRNWNKKRDTNMDELINYDIQAKEAGLIVGITNEIYFCSISRTSTVYVEWIDKRWMAWRETYLLNSSKRRSYKRIAHGEFEEVIQRVKGYLEFIQNNQK